MRAAQYMTTGPTAGRLELVELPTPTPGPGEVIVRVAVSGVNPTDWKGRAPGSMTAGEFDRIVPNQDGAGEIVGVGPGVDTGRVGERVWLWQAQWQRAHGTASELVALPCEQAVALPSHASLDLGAGLGIPAMTAHRCLFASGPLDGATVLVQGGAGAVGHAAIELARWGGARVAATVSSPEKAELARAAGAELVVNYREQDVVELVSEWAPQGVDRVVEVDLAANAATDAALLAIGGVVSTFSLTDPPAVPQLELMRRNAVLDFVLVYTMGEEAKRRAVADVGAALDAGALTPLPAFRFPLEQIAAAHDAVEAGAVGKVLVDLPLDD